MVFRLSNFAGPSTFGDLFLNVFCFFSNEFVENDDLAETLATLAT